MTSSVHVSYNLYRTINVPSLRSKVLTQILQWLSLTDFPLISTANLAANSREYLENVINFYLYTYILHL